MKKKALITGIYGQDGSYLCEILIDKGYDVYGIAKNELSQNSINIKKFLDINNVNPIVFNIDLNSFEEVSDLLKKLRPDEIYHLAAMHNSSQAKATEVDLFNNNILNTSNILEAAHRFSPETKVILAGSCLMYDNSDTQIQNENVPFNSKSLYGIAKITENNLAKYYCSKGFFACSAILYNHESSRRKDDFVTKKIVKNMVAIKQNKINKFMLGDINVKKDWGYAKDYAYGLYLMAQQSKPKDFILSSGKLYSIKDFIEICASLLNITDYEKYIETNAVAISRTTNTVLCGDNNLAKEILKWNNQMSLEELIKLMIDNEINGTLI